jgi:peptide/nickel transport system substrate-binding protein
MKRVTRLLVVIGLILLVSLPIFAAGQKDSATAEGVGAANSNPLSDVRVRQAIAYAIDMDTIASTLLEGKATVAISPVPKGPWRVSGLNPYSYDPEKAKSLLSDADWDKNYVLDVVFYYGDQLTVDLMTAVQSYLAAVGIKMDFRKLEGDLGKKLWTPPEDRVNGPSFVTWDIVYGGAAALAMNEYFVHYTSYAGGNSNTPADMEIDRLYEATLASANPEVQRNALFDIEKYFNSNLPNMPLYHQPLFVYESTRVNRNGGEYGNAQYNYDWNIVNWTVEKDTNGKQVLYTNTAPAEFFEHPWYNPGVHMASRVLFDHLIVADSALMAKSGQLSSSYTVSDDGMEISFILKDGLKWHDGSSLTVDDVEWSVEYALQIPAVHGVIGSTFKALKGSEDFINGIADNISGIVTEGNKISFIFADLDPNMLMSFCQFAPLPKKYFEGADPLQFQQDNFWQHPIGSGPFKLDKVEMNDYTVMVPFEEYHDGVAKIDEIILYPSGENDSNVIMNATAGKLDYGFTKNVADVQALENLDSMNVFPIDIPYTRLLIFNKFPKP